MLPNFQLAAEYVQQNGTVEERARLARLFNNAQGVSILDIPSELVQAQRPDGGFSPFWAPHASSLDATCYRLSHAVQLGCPPSSSVIRAALGFLVERQSPGGYWQEDDALASEAPPWVQPDKLDATLYLTANCGFWLAHCGDSATVPSVQQAARFLVQHMESSGHLPSFLQTQWLTAGVFLFQSMHDEAVRALKPLEERCPELSASDLAWMISTLHSAGLNAASPLLKDATARLTALQCPDGSWTSDDGPSQTVHVTLEALGVLV